MITRELETFLIAVTGFAPSEVDQRTRPLRDNDLIPHGPRGSHAPHLEPNHIALVLLSMVSRRAVDALEVMNRAKSLTFVPRRSEWSLLPEDSSLAQVLASAFADESFVIDRLEVSSNGAVAFLDFERANRFSTVIFAGENGFKELVKSIPPYFEYFRRHAAGGVRFVYSRDALAEIVRMHRRKGMPPSRKAGSHRGETQNSALAVEL